MHVYAGPKDPTPQLRPALEAFCTSSDLPAVDVPARKSVWQLALLELFGLHTYLVRLPCQSSCVMTTEAVFTVPHDKPTVDCGQH